MGPSRGHGARGAPVDVDIEMRWTRRRRRGGAQAGGGRDLRPPRGERCGGPRSATRSAPTTPTKRCSAALEILLQQSALRGPARPDPLDPDRGQARGAGGAAPSASAILAGPPPRPADPGREDWVAMLPAEVAGPAERAERHEAIERSREALATLKPQELRALSLLAEGYSYREIAEITGYSSTKVNRCASPRGASASAASSSAATAAPAATSWRRCSPPSPTARRARPTSPPCASTCAPAPTAAPPCAPTAPRRGAAAALLAGPAAGPRRHRRAALHDAYAGGRDAGRRRHGRLRLDPRRARRGGRHARRRDDGAGQGAGDLRRDGRRRRRLRRDRGRPGAARSTRPPTTPTPAAKVAHHRRAPGRGPAKRSRTYEPAPPSETTEAEAEPEPRPQEAAAPTGRNDEPKPKPERSGSPNGKRRDRRSRSPEPPPSEAARPNTSNRRRNRPRPKRRAPRRGPVRRPRPAAAARLERHRRRGVRAVSAQAPGRGALHGARARSPAVLGCPTRRRRASDGVTPHRPARLDGGRSGTPTTSSRVEWDPNPPTTRSSDLRQVRDARHRRSRHLAGAPNGRRKPAPRASASRPSPASTCSKPGTGSASTDDLDRDGPAATVALLLRRRAGRAAAIAVTAPPGSRAGTAGADPRRRSRRAAAGLRASAATRCRSTAAPTRVALRRRRPLRAGESRPPRRHRRTTRSPCPPRRKGSATSTRSRCRARGWTRRATATRAGRRRRHAAAGAARGRPRRLVAGPVKVTALATDPLSGMAAAGPGGPLTAIAVDGAPAAAAPGAAASATVAGEGIHSVAYWARDAVGNAGDGSLPSPTRRRRRCGSTKPTRPCASPPPDPADPERIEATVADALSGPRRPRRDRAAPGRQRRPLPAAADRRSPRGRLVARWSSDDFPRGHYEFRATGYDARGQLAAGRPVPAARRWSSGKPVKGPVPLAFGFGGRRLVLQRCARTDGGRRCHRQSSAPSPGARRRAPSLRPRRPGRRAPARRRGAPLRRADGRGGRDLRRGARVAVRRTPSRTDADGSFVTRLAPGPSRGRSSAGSPAPPPHPARGRELRLAVRAGVRLRVSTARARSAARRSSSAAGSATRKRAIPPRAAGPARVPPARLALGRIPDPADRRRRALPLPVLVQRRRQRRRPLPLPRLRPGDRQLAVRPGHLPPPRRHRLRRPTNGRPGIPGRPRYAGWLGGPARCSAGRRAGRRPGSTRALDPVRQVLIVEVGGRRHGCWRLRTSRSTRVRVLRASVVARTGGGATSLGAFGLSRSWCGRSALSRPWSAGQGLDEVAEAVADGEDDADREVDAVSRTPGPGFLRDSGLGGGGFGPLSRFYRPIFWLRWWRVSPGFSICCCRWCSA